MRCPSQRSGRREAERLFEPLDVGRPDLRVNDARRPLAVERIQHLLGGDPAHILARFLGHACGVRARQHIVELQERMIRRRRLLGPDIEAGAREFALMQPHAYFITTARGFIHDEGALEQALRDKRIAGAGLDVWAKEPPPPDHPLLQFDNVIASPHTAGVTKEARENMARIAAEQMLDALDGKRPPRLINPEVWPAYVKRFERTFGFAPG